MTSMPEVTTMASATGFELLNLDYSPIKGPEGNIEYLLLLKNVSDTETKAPLSEIEAVVTASQNALSHK